jgi:hypothetical protein
MGLDSGRNQCSPFVLMGERVQWTRWGRGMCEGWSLEIGTAYRGAVVRQERIDQPPTWLASVNAAYLGEYPERESGMACVENEIQQSMELSCTIWGLFCRAK